MFSSYSVSFFFKDECVEKLRQLFILSTKRDFINISITAILTVKPATLSRAVNETVLISAGKTSNLLYVPLGCIQKRNTTIRIHKNAEKNIAFFYKLVEGYIKESLGILYEEDGEIPSKFINPNLNVKLSFLLNLGVVFSFIFVRENLNLKF